MTNPNPNPNPLKLKVQIMNIAWISSLEENQPFL